MTALKKLFPSTVQVSEGIVRKLTSTLSNKATYVLEFNSDNAGAWIDITSDCFSLDCWRGRNYASQISGKSTAGSLNAVMDNNTGRYSSFHVHSDLYGLLLPGREIRFRTTDPSSVTLWTGYLESVIPNVSSGPFVTATLKARGALIKIAQKYISPPALATSTTGEVVNAILDAVDWPVSRREIDGGEVTIDRWFVEDRSALELLYEMEDTEWGILQEGLAFDVKFESRYHRLTSHVTPFAEFSDAPDAQFVYNRISQEDPMQEVYNKITATVRPHTVQALAVVWTLSDVPFDLAAGASITYIGQASGDTVYVEEWTTPVVGTDITQTGVSNGDIGVSVSKTATKIFITITNNHASTTATITLVQARGTAVTQDNPYQVSAEDAASIAKYQERTYPLPSPWYTSATVAQASCDYFVQKNAETHPILSIQIPGNRDANTLRQCLERDLSDLVSIVADGGAQLGLSGDFYIEAIEHSVERGKIHTTKWDLSQAGQPGSTFWVLGTSELDTDTVVAYA